MSIHITLEKKKKNRILEYMRGGVAYKQQNHISNLIINIPMTLLASSVTLYLVKNLTSFYIYQSYEKVKQLLNSKHLRKLKESTSLLKHFDKNEREEKFPKFLYSLETLCTMLDIHQVCLYFLRHNMKKLIVSVVFLFKTKQVKSYHLFIWKMQTARSN